MAANNYQSEKFHVTVRVDRYPSFSISRKQRQRNAFEHTTALSVNAEVMCCISSAYTSGLSMATTILHRNVSGTTVCAAEFGGGTYQSSALVLALSSDGFLLNGDAKTVHTTLCLRIRQSQPIAARSCYQIVDDRNTSQFQFQSNYASP